MNLPLTAGFISEFLVLLGSAQLESFVIIFIGALGVFTNGIYCIWLFNRVCMGSNLLINNFKITFSDIDRRENFILFIFCFIIFLLGVFPNFLLISFEPYIFELLWQKLV